MFSEDITGKKVEYLGKKSDDPKNEPVPPGTRGIVEAVFTSTAIVHWEGSGGSSVIEHDCLKIVEG